MGGGGKRQDKRTMSGTVRQGHRNLEESGLHSSSPAREYYNLPREGRKAPPGNV